LGRLVYAVAATAALCVEVAAAPACAAEAKAAVEGTLDPALRAAIVAEIGETDRPADNRFEARRRANEAAEAAIAVLRSEGYYEYLVEPELGEDDSPRPTVRINPGPRFTIVDPQIEWVGSAPSEAAQAAARRSLRLRPGEPGRAADVVAAEGRVVAAVQQKGYADAAAEPREVVVDHADHSVRPSFRIAAGPLVRLDGINLTSTGRTSRRWVESLAPWKPGEVYTPDLIGELERRLLDPGAFDSVTVGLAPADKTSPDGLRPVVVSLSERKRRSIELGASYATEEGFGLDLRWTRYNLLGRADTLAVLGRISNVDSRAGVTLTLPGWRRPAETLTLGAQFYNADTPAYNQRGFQVRADAQRRFTKTSYFTYGASVDLSRTDEVTPGTLQPLGRDIATFALLSEIYLDHSDDPLDPRRGFRIGGRLQPTFLVGQGTLPYLRAEVQGSTYLPLDRRARTVIATRVKLGSIFNGSVDDIPAPQRFYAGGGGSVRGFAYQAVGPRLSDNTPQGGLSLIETSFELRHRLTPKWEVVGFVDAGAIGTKQFSNYGDMSVGAGLGVRYNLSFGPVRVDIATPLTNRRDGAPLQLYVSLGQSF
jgi:translocation and assembly module TamA